TACRPVRVAPYWRPDAARDVSASPFEPRSLRRAGDFRRVLSGGRRVKRGPVTVAAVPGDPGPARVGLVVGRRVGNAVERNRAKRRLRHALTQIQLEQGMDYVIIADREVLDIPFGSLVERLAAAVAAGA